MERIFIEKTTQKIGERVSVAGWIHTRRDHGKLIFIDLRDRSGLLQVVFKPALNMPALPAPSGVEGSFIEGSNGPDAQNAALYERAKTLRSEWVVGVEGVIAERPDNMRNPGLPTGSLELIAENLVIHSKAKTPPFELSDERAMGAVDEELRLRYRYLDLRRPPLFSRLKLRNDLIQFLRVGLLERGFVEIETPILTKSTPEGARDFLVPSRLHPGKFYALPQSPQQYKQLLMAAGFERYFQIARCFRDEDTRGDRQPEFTQLDLEMSFVSQEDILQLTEELLTKAIEELTECTISQKPFPRISHKDVMERYGADKPDLRKNKDNPKELAFAWILEWPLLEWSTEEQRYSPLHHIFTAPREEDIPLFDSDPLKVRSWQHDLVCNGYEVGGGSIRNHQRDIQEKIFSLVGIAPEEARIKFGHLLEAFEYGAPPHGGIAPGIDRLLMLMLGQPNIREVMAFPKTGDGRDPMMDSPSEVNETQLRELGIQLRK